MRWSGPHHARLIADGLNGCSRETSEKGIRSWAAWSRRLVPLRNLFDFSHPPRKQKALAIEVVKSPIISSLLIRSGILLTPALAEQGVRPVKTHALIGMRPTGSVESLESLEERIRSRAYDLFERRGRADGRDLEDWLQAEWEENEKSPIRMQVGRS